MKEKRELIYTFKTSWNLCDDQFLLKLQNNLCFFFLVCFVKVQVMMRPWSLFIECLGSYSHYRLTNGLLPRVLGPTSFYLKIWVNILTIRMLLCYQGWTSECCCVLHQNVDVYDVLHLGSALMNVWWVSRFVQCVPYDFPGFIHKKLLFHMHQKVAG